MVLKVEHMPSSNRKERKINKYLKSHMLQVKLLPLLKTLNDVRIQWVPPNQPDYKNHVILLARKKLISSFAVGYEAFHFSVTDLNITIWQLVFHILSDEWVVLLYFSVMQTPVH